MFAVNGILFNHESPRRGRTFVTRKITSGIANILSGREDYITLGNIDSKRDWGYAPDYVEAMWLMLQQDTPEDYVIGTGKTWSVREFLERAFNIVNMHYEDHVRFDGRFLRPNEVDCLMADYSKAAKELEWEPKVGFDDLVSIMVDADIDSAGLYMSGAGKAAMDLRPGDWHTWQDQIISME